MKEEQLGWVTRDGLKMYGRIWKPGGEPAAVICLVHGLGEHIGRYEHVASFLTDDGYVLTGFDLRGHGRSEGPRGHAPTYDLLMDDVEDFLREAAQRYPKAVQFLYGHSLGGNLVVNFCLRRRPSLKGAVVSGPAFRPAFRPPVWKLTMGKWVYSLWPKLAMPNGLERAALSRDPAVVRAYEADPLVHDKISARLGLDLLNSGEWALTHAAELPLPLLLMHGSGDRLTSPQASEEFARKAGKFCTLKIWNGLYHEIHNDPEKAEVVAFMAAWIRKQLVKNDQ
jgi:alpha-beta hydrolase superfamily lysophospholipase